MGRPKGSKNKPTVKRDSVFGYPIPADELKEGVIPDPVMVIKSKCSHSHEHHDPEKKWCHSCGCLAFNGCGEE